MRKLPTLPYSFYSIAFFPKITTFFCGGRKIRSGSKKLGSTLPCFVRKITSMNLETTLKNFEKNGFKTRHFSNPNELQEFLKSEIRDMSVGMGGSVSLSQLGVYETLKDTNQEYWHAVDKSPETFEKASLAQVYILSANALTENGEIVNIDGRGNRVSGAIFGANRQKVLYICGTNKIEENLEKATWRAKNVAAPKNAQRLGLKTPCAIKADKCYNCMSPQRICRATAIISRPTSAETTIIIVDGDWGY